MFANKATFKRSYKKKIASMFGKSLEDASLSDKYVALASMLRDAINDKWIKTNDTYLIQGHRQVYYFSLEFLVGKFLEAHLLYTGMGDICRQGLAELGIDLDELFGVEPDAGLGNGGLGRLAACFLDSIASMSLPGHGCGIRYKYGLFSQKIIDGYQVELPDNWLRETNAWEICKPDKAVVIKFGGRVETSFDETGKVHFEHVGYVPVLAVPYDMPILGYRNNTVNTLRLWSAEAIDSYFDFSSFSRGDYISAVSNRYAVEAISEVLYPDDSNYQNRQLRLKQQYFFVSAGLTSIVRRFKRKHLDITHLSDRIAVHINDTHPALAVPELMRILIDEEGMGWEDAWAQTTSIIAYTNHTILPEALETWPVDTFRELLPRMMMIVEEINRRFCLELTRAYPNDSERVRRMSIISDGVVKMANLAVVGSHSVNGVAAVHSELLKSVVMRELHEFFPEKFNNKTNGVTHRRWLIKSNPPLTDMISELIGEKWISAPERLKGLLDFRADPVVLDRLRRIKRQNKERLAAYIMKNNGVAVDPDSIFDVQVKRVHAYKRQLLNALHILHLYNQICDNPALEMTPRTFIIAGKAAPSYYYAKNIIKFINELALVIHNDSRVDGRIKLVFLENYGIPIAELVFPASDVSEQISTASKEASGTGNMKFMMNGAVTIGTDDGANIEIRELVGDDNFFLFGLKVRDVLDYYANGGYNAAALAESDTRLSRILAQLQGGLSPRVPHDEFNNITRSLLQYNDEFFVLRDFDSYADTQARLGARYCDQEIWQRMALTNIAFSGHFSSDHTIGLYASEIWNVQPCKIVGSKA
ncbi:MAG: glycogen/starch/alpha-glucan phosphorylase [Oscillospiraceae bacterium]|jgi:starch phosphorylase|nr:glycogen/starch/alpha-glucan phosphorylase [Oscillospiraceae bacterium]